MRLGLVGTGKIVKEVFNFINNVERTDVVAVCGRNEAELNKICDEHYVPARYTNYDEFLTNWDVDTVYIGLPNALHYEYARKALESGKHVILEKPFTSNYDETLDLYQLAAEKNQVLLEAISNQYNPNLDKIRELIPTLGKVRIVSLNYSQYSSGYDAFKNGEITPKFDANLAGGALMDQNVYNVHVLVKLFGMPQKVKYVANVDRGVDTSGILTLQYKKFKASLIAAKDCGAPARNLIEGEKGCIWFDDQTNTINSFTYQLNGEEPMTYELNGDKHRMQAEFEAFAEIVNNQDVGKAQELGKQTANVMKLLTLARKSADIVYPFEMEFTE